MATKDKTLTLLGSQAVVQKVELLLDAKGNYKLGAFGTTKDDSSNVVWLNVGLEDIASGTALIDNVFAHALSVLRKANGLE